jgi:hypothetical protein
MFPYLSAGEARRTLSDSDLNIIDADEGGSPEPLLAGASPSLALQYAAGESFATSALVAASATNGGAPFTASTTATGPASYGSLSEVASLARRRWLFDDSLSTEALLTEPDSFLDEAGQDAWSDAISAHGGPNGLDRIEFASVATKGVSLTDAAHHAAPAATAQAALVEGIRSPASVKSAVDSLFSSDELFGLDVGLSMNASPAEAGEGLSALAEQWLTQSSASLAGSSEWSASAFEAAELETVAGDLGSECADAVESLCRAIVDAMFSVIGS